MKQIFDKAKINIDTAKNDFDNLQIFCKNLFVDVNPIPVKYVLYKMGLIKYSYRLPLTKLSQKDEVVLDYTFNLMQKKSI